MKLENRCVAPADRETIWRILTDVPRAATLVPGVEQVTQEGENRYKAAVKVKVGPMSLTLNGSILLAEQDLQAGRARYQLEATDRRVGGAVKADMVAQLNPQPDGQTELLITTDATFMGKLGELGQPIIRRKAAGTLEDFANNLAKEVGQK